MKRLLTFFGVLVLCFLSLTEANAQNRKKVSAAEVTGTFSADKDEFKISALGKGKLLISFSGIYGYESAYGKTANMG